jgi:hypothetical protein
MFSGPVSGDATGLAIAGVRPVADGTLGWVF